MICIRHGEAEHHLDGRTGGWTDSRLTERGRLQAGQAGRRAAQLVAGRPFRFCSSDLARAAETARIVGQAVGIEPAMTPALRELGNGQAANLPREAARKIARPFAEPRLDWIHYPGGESWRMMVERVAGFLDRMDAEMDGRGGALLLVHAASAMAAINWFLGDPWRPLSFRLAPCAISHLALNRWGERAMLKHNDEAHLA